MAQDHGADWSALQGKAEPGMAFEFSPDQAANWTPLIEDAESQANPDGRIRFRYDWLRQDLVRIRAGIQEHIDAPRTEPRTFPPLRGDYRR